MFFLLSLLGKNRRLVILYPWIKGNGGIYFCRYQIIYVYKIVIANKYSKKVTGTAIFAKLLIWKSTAQIYWQISYNFLPKISPNIMSLHIPDCYRQYCKYWRSYNFLANCFRILNSFLNDVNIYQILEFKNNINQSVFWNMLYIKAKKYIKSTVKYKLYGDFS